jgi:hypothetical protein
MADDTILCWRTHATVGDVKAWLATEDRTSIAEFLWNRFDERYFAPFEPLTITQRNGFMTMAVCCLVIEALESFYQGWESSEGKKSQLAFCSFLDREQDLHVFKGYGQSFYKHVRCGILHQAETTGGWNITLMPGEPLFDSKRLRVQADEFRKVLARSLTAYKCAMSQAGPNDELWKNCKTKLGAILKNCG